MDPATSSTRMSHQMDFRTRRTWDTVEAMPTIATIGVYEFDGPSFVRALDGAGVTQIIDVRQRRGVRGSQYAWANSKRLQERLAQARIAYEYHPELAPDTEMRHLQYREDTRQGVGKRSREALSPEYVSVYTEEILDLVPLEPLIRRLPVHGIAALLCVEATSRACHRSLLAERLAERFGFEVINIEPMLPTEIDFL
jgi:uncharacterized protein (DUF488 family)